MRFSYFLVLFVAVGATAQGLASDANSFQVNNTKSSHAIVNGDRSLFNLKGSITMETKNDAADEERNKVSLFGKLASAFKGNSKYVKTLETSPAFINAVKKNPDLTRILKEDKALVKILAKNPTLIKEFENPAVTKTLGDALKNPSLLKNFLKNRDVQSILATLPTTTSGMTRTNFQKIGQAIGISERTGGIAVIVGTIIILIVAGVLVAKKVL
ncbi:hypothetical protein PRNP1_004531 [Phytophthora ramorum]